MFTLIINLDQLLLLKVDIRSSINYCLTQYQYTASEFLVQLQNFNAQYLGLGGYS